MLKVIVFQSRTLFCGGRSAQEIYSMTVSLSEQLTKMVEVKPIKLVNGAGLKIINDKQTCKLLRFNVSGKNKS